jgi:hypothetical protein
MIRTTCRRCGRCSSAETRRLETSRARRRRNASAQESGARRRCALGSGYEIEVVRERPTFVEAIVRRGTEAVILQWTRQRFPLVEHPELARGALHFHAGSIRGVFPQIM